MTPELETLKRDWEKRVEKFGSTKRSVLCKGLPDFLNNSIHNQQSRYVMKFLPDECGQLLDVGCGYGRLARDIKQRRQCSIEGVELTESFARVFNQEIGICYNQPIQEFQPTKKYDAILLITILMYLNKDDLTATIDKLWAALPVGGRLICIEPAVEYINLFRRLTGKHDARPTGQAVNYFSAPALVGQFNRLAASKLVDIGTLGLHSLLPFITVYQALTVEKTA